MSIINELIFSTKSDFANKKWTTKISENVKIVASWLEQNWFKWGTKYWHNIFEILEPF